MKPEGKKIVILCEGETQEIAVRHFIWRQWEADGLRPIGLRPINLRGKLEDVFDYVPRYRRESDVLAVFTLIDLYEMKRVKADVQAELSERVTRAQHWLRNNFGADYDNFFYPHASVHEVEAWLLAEGECLAKRLKDAKIKPDRNAELKNLDNPPSKRIASLFKAHRRNDEYHKINDGTPLFKCLQFQPVYDACPYFRMFYDELKTAGQSALKGS